MVRRNARYPARLLSLGSARFPIAIIVCAGNTQHAFWEHKDAPIRKMHFGYPTSDWQEAAERGERASEQVAEKMYQVGRVDRRPWLMSLFRWLYPNKRSGGFYPQSATMVLGACSHLYSLFFGYDDP